jgi:hypothetical protein
MRRQIPIQANPGTPEIEIDGTLLADAFGLEVGVFRQLMQDRKVTVLCERGTGADAGLHRASFYYERTRVRVVVDADGRPVGGIERTRTGA